MTWLHVLWVGVACGVVQMSSSSKILMIPYSGEGSHYLSMALVGERLVSNGHNVSFLVADLFNFTLSNPHHSTLFTYEKFPHHLGRDGFHERVKSQNERLLSGHAVYHAIVAFDDIIRNFSMDCEDIVRNVPLRERLVNAQFDFAVADPTTPCGVIIAGMLKIPHGLFLPISAVPTLTRFLSVPTDPSYVSSWQSGYSHRMSFRERTVNTLMDFSWSFFFNVALYSYHDALRHKYDLGSQVSSRNGMSQSHFSLSFADWTLEYPRPFTPNVFGSAGLNIAEKRDKMSEKWENFIDANVTEGMVLVSFGTLLHWLPSAVTEKLVDAFSQLPYTIVWQMSRNTQLGLTNLPTNIHLFEWLPVPSLLAHEKTVLFINHAGINSLYESIYFSKPILTFPLFGDQPDIARRTTDRQIGLDLHLYKSSPHEIVEAVHQIISESSYNDNLKDVTAMFRTKPDQARELLPFVIEQALRSKTFLLQRCKGQDMSFVQYYMLDVIGFMLVFIGLTIMMLKHIISSAYRSIF